MSPLFTERPGPAVEAGWRALLAGDAGAGGHAELAALYGPIVTRPDIDRTFVIGQSGQSLDGFIATRTGHSHFVTGPESLVHLHRLRALVDAVVVGAATVASDDPQLSVRRCAGPSPTRVVVDPRARLEASHKAFRGEGNVIRMVQRGAALRSGDVEIESDDTGLSPQAMIRTLSERGHRRILVEGGGRLVSSFLRGGCLDRLHVVVAPLLIGDGIRGPLPTPVDDLGDALRPPSKTVAMGADVLFDLDLRAS